MRPPRPQRPRSSSRNSSRHCAIQPGDGVSQCRAIGQRARANQAFGQRQVARLHVLIDLEEIDDFPDEARQQQDDHDNGDWQRGKITQHTRHHRNRRQRRDNQVGKATRPLAEIEVVYAENTQEKAREKRGRLVLRAVAIVAAELLTLACGEMRSHAVKIH